MVQKFTKMKEEYVIINKSVLEKRIEELFTEAKELLEEDGLEWQDEFLNYKDFSPNFEEYSDNSKYFYIIMGKIESLQDFLSQSTPLIPEIEKHSIEFTKTLLSCTVSEAKSINNIKEYHPKEYQLLLGELELNGKKIFEDYISNLKLDI